jgi:GH15 family glucan-1,4-alpha-glucosidase
MTLGLSLVSGVLLIAPYVRDQTLTLLPKLVSIGYPMGDIILLAAGIRLAVPADDPRTLATLASVEHELSEDGYAYRYQPDDRPLGESEGAFLLCGLWMALAWHQQGEAVRATRWFERARAACGSPGIFSEEYDVTQRQLRGNLPQAFVHALVLECAVTLG